MAVVNPASVTPSWPWILTVDPLDGMKVGPWEKHGIDRNSSDLVDHSVLPARCLPQSFSWLTDECPWVNVGICQIF